MSKPDSLLPAIKEALFREWDPIGVKDNEACRNEYDAYAVSIWRLFRENADEYKLTQFLGHVQRVSMGLSIIDTEADGHTARRLLALRFAET